MLRIVTWNMNRRSASNTMRAAWSLLAERASGGIACVQEAHVPIDLPHVPYEPYYKGFGTSIVSYGPELVPDTTLSFAPGRTAFARVVTDKGRMVRIASLHGFTGTIRGFAGKQIPAYVVLDWLENDLRPLLVAATSGADVVIAGDLNTSTQWSAPSAHAKIADAFASCGFTNALAGAAQYGDLWGACPCGARNCAHAPTYRSKRMGEVRWWSIDYIWVSSSLRDRVLRAEVENAPDGRWSVLSDHAPALVYLDV